MIENTESFLLDIAAEIIKKRKKKKHRKTINESEVISVIAT
jgi:hypothetical protein